MNIQIALRQGKQLLYNHSPCAQIDNEILLSFVLNKPKSFLYSHPEYVLTQQEQNLYEKNLNRRLVGEPIAYIIGKRNFWSIELEVNPSTLIPRAETELLIEITLQLFNDKNNATILDLGTGSGAIALSVAVEKPQWKFKAIDNNQQTLECAKKNAKNLGIKNVEFMQSNWFSALKKEKFDAIITNPPYLAETDLHLKQADLRFEPKSALIGGKNGLEAINLIIQESHKFLKPGGLLLIEHGYNQKEKIQNMLNKFKFINVFSVKDFQGIHRVCGGWNKK